MDTLRQMLENWKTHLAVGVVGALGAYLGVDWLDILVALMGVGWDFTTGVVTGLVAAGGA